MGRLDGIANRDVDMFQYCLGHDVTPLVEDRITIEFD